jgi:hypothetical protein
VRRWRNRGDYGAFVVGLSCRVATSVIVKPGGLASLGSSSLFREKVVRFLDVHGLHRDNDAVRDTYSLILSQEPAITYRWTPGWYEKVNSLG